MASSDAAAPPSSHGFTGAEKSHRPSQPDTFSSARFASARDESARSGRAMSVTSVLLPVVTLPKMCLSAPHAGFARPVNIPLRKSSLMQSSCFFSILSATAFPFFFG